MTGRFGKLEAEINYSYDRKSADISVSGERVLTIKGEEHVDLRSKKPLEGYGAYVIYHKNVDGTIDSVRVEQRR